MQDVKAHQKPLAGVRVLEIAIQVAMPGAIKMFAAMGAEVIKLEGMARPCGLRWSGPFPDNDPTATYFNRSGYYCEVNSGKFGIGVDLSVPEGQELCKELVKKSDVVVENFTPRVLRKFGLDYENLRKVKPDIIMASVTGFGHSGPWSDYAAYGMNVEALAGVPSVTGYPGEQPTRCGMAYIDDLAAQHASFAILSALHYRNRTGKGQWIDAAMYEAGSLVPELVLEYQMAGRTLEPIGNRHPAMAPHGIYRCQGPDNWVAVAVASDAEWRALCGAMGAEELARDERFATIVARLRNQVELDATISAWTQILTSAQVMELLQAADIAAGPVCTNADLLFSPQLKERGFFQILDHGDEGEHPLAARPYPGAPWRFSRTPGSFERPAPTFGQHNHDVLQRVLELDDERIRDLESRGVIGNSPGAGSMQLARRQMLEDMEEQGRIERHDVDFKERLSGWFGEAIGRP